ncbi:PP2C family protein-serine/threonine phosphatase [Pseudotabrizicola algicola]|uniref:Fused response regulator/phosphatase n=1 Tax=Pseudotabrizicola algicola TaxID=2709381 RepID=A0A6B3RRH8_9RHOB|nr:SpoIIE family protein phosphatase [Pseudotabrizicola algicola]NEX48071.1 fused response regulator/phosphatase [Pseudotabrizicola algicola]
MEFAKPDTSAHSPDPQNPLRVLVVDDSKAQRMMLTMSLSRWGYVVDEAASGEAALLACQSRQYDIILSDWMMDGMSGLELCAAFRGLGQEGYAYFILLTSKSEKTEIAKGLEAGADDFLTKPVSADELRARLRAGERIVGMHKELVQKNRLLGATLTELQRAHDTVHRDLIEARKLQQTLVRERFRDWGRGAATLFLRTSGHVGGDLAGFFELNASHVALYSVDVSGHGVASAMMTARLAGYLSAAAPDQNIAFQRRADGGFDALPPEQVAARFNRTMLEDLQVDQYFTMAYAQVDLGSGSVALVQAGHPYPLILRADGTIDRLGNGGLPIGLLGEAVHERVTAQLYPGDRLFLLSDGLTECPSPTGQELGEDGLEAMIRKNRAMASAQLLDALIWDLAAHMGSEEFPDDVSGLLFDYRG